MDGVAPASPMKQGHLRVAELFCGPGGLYQGFKQAALELGYSVESVLACDEDNEALGIYSQNHKTEIPIATSASMLVEAQVFGSGDLSEYFSHPRVADVRLKNLVGNIDVVLAGPPCQGHSNLNNKTRRRDPRNELYLTVPALAIAVKARTVIIENVPEVVHDHKSVVSTTIKLLMDAGYKIECGVLRADHIGWPQTRKRFFLVARLDQNPIPFAEIKSQLASEPLSAMWAIGDLEDVMSDDFMDRRTELSETNQSRVEYLHDNNEFDLPNSERPDCHKEGTTYRAVYGRMYPDKPAPTLTTGFMTPGRGRYTHPTRPRVLTPREAARIQGFPDAYDFRAPDGAASPKSKLAKWIGDAVPMPLGYAASLSALA